MIAILADVHGNAPALEAVLADIDAQGVTQIYSLGDVCGYYSMVNASIDLLRERNIVNLMGNHDLYIAEDGECPRSRSANDCLLFQKRVLTPDRIAWVQKSPSHLAFGDVRLVHGGWQDAIDEYVYAPTDAYFSAIDGRFFFSGHTHVQRVTALTGKVHCNPGSVGQPRDGDWRAAYALFDPARGSVTLHRVPYDVARIAAHMQASGFAPYYYENLYHGTRIGGKID